MSQHDDTILNPFQQCFPEGLSSLAFFGDSIDAQKISEGGSEASGNDGNETIEVFAPPGKLGFVIDPMHDQFVVHAVKDSSVLAVDLKTGDKLIALDGEDTNLMSGKKVKKLISSKADNPVRHMVFLRRHTLVNTSLDSKAILADLRSKKGQNKRGGQLNSNENTLQHIREEQESDEDSELAKVPTTPRSEADAPIAMEDAFNQSFKQKHQGSPSNLSFLTAKQSLSSNDTSNQDSRNNRETSTDFQNQMKSVEIVAPSGSLGLVIDTPTGGGRPTVHNIIDSSALMNKVKIGDQLIFLDGEDTSQMSATRVTEIVRSKATNSKRQMIFLRPKATPEGKAARKGGAEKLAIV